MPPDMVASWEGSPDASSHDTSTLSLSVRRDGRDFTLDYLPRGEAVTVYTWERIPGVEDAACPL